MHHRHVKAGCLAGLLLTHIIAPPTAESAVGGRGSPENEVRGSVRLADLLAEAREHNPELQAARQRWEAARQRVPQAKGLPAPRIGIEFEEIPKGTVKVNQATLMYSLIQSLPFPGKRSLRHQVAIKDAGVAAMDFKQSEWSVLSDLKTAYYDLFLLDRDLEIQQEQHAWLEQAAAASEARYATGDSVQADVLRLQGKALEAANQLQVLQHRRAALATHLNHLLNRPPEQAVGAPEPVALIPLPESAQELLLYAQDHQPELLAFKYAAERAAAAWRLSKRELLPDLETMIELRDPAMGPLGPWDLTLAAVLPFWFWTKQKYGVKVALADKASAEAAYEAMRSAIAQRVHEHWHQAQAAYITAKLCQDRLIELARQAVTSTSAAYQSGSGSFLDVIEALNQLGEQQRTYYQHVVMMEQHVVMVEQAAGKSLRPSHAVTSDEWPVTN